MSSLRNQHIKPDADQTARRGFWSQLWPSRLAPEQARHTAQMRLLFAGALAITCFAGIGAKAFPLATVSHNGDTEVHVRLAGADRGAIYDRNGRILAQTVPVMTLHADPKQILDPYEVADKLSSVLPDLTRQDILAALSRKTRYVELNRKITPRRHAASLGLGLPGIFITPSNLRTYPNGAEAAHILGQVNRDGLGIAGIEKSMQARLSSGRDVTLSVDLGVQAVVRRALAAQIEKFEALGGIGLVSNIKT
ncbi:MAG: penicillin-binding protein 2, partial [Pseudomonadota bacterium]|nr:penicillin-binding protein 2 [Pseudomonadota bacterium]